MPRPRSPSLPQGRWRPKRKAGRRTKPRPHQRKPMHGGISRNFPNRRRLRESPRGTSRQGDGARLRPGPRPDGVARGFGPGRLRQGGKASGPPSKYCFDGTLGRALGEGRPEGSRPRCEPWNRQASAGRIQPGTRKSGISVLPEAARRDRREAFGPLPRPTGGRTGREPRSGIRGARRVRPTRSRSRPARDGLATQRRQSRLGQVGAGGDTGPHYFMPLPPCRVGFRALIRFAIVS
jgi:hypothetical protein